MMKNHRKKWIAVDLDGTLCKEICFTAEEVSKATPVKKIVDKVNEWHLHNSIIIWTARRNELLTATAKWLDKHNIQFDAISNHKLAADIYVDDKMVHPRDIKSENKGRNKQGG